MKRILEVSIGKEIEFMIHILSLCVLLLNLLGIWEDLVIYMLSENKKVIRMGNVSTKNSQGGTVYSPGGVSPTICAGTHGYALGYIVVKNFISGCNKGEGKV